MAASRPSHGNIGTKNDILVGLHRRRRLDNDDRRRRWLDNDDRRRRWLSNDDRRRRWLSNDDRRRRWLGSGGRRIVPKEILGHSNLSPPFLGRKGSQPLELS
jgi:hypothetical protein